MSTILGAAHDNMPALRVRGRRNRFSARAPFVANHDGSRQSKLNAEMVAVKLDRFVGGKIDAALVK